MCSGSVTRSMYLSIYLGPKVPRLRKYFKAEVSPPPPPYLGTWTLGKDQLTNFRAEAPYTPASNLIPSRRHKGTILGFRVGGRGSWP